MNVYEAPDPANDDSNWNCDNCGVLNYSDASNCINCHLTRGLIERDPMTIKVKVKETPTPTELMAKLGALHYRDPAINTALSLLLRRLADGIDSGQVAIKNITSTISKSADEFPSMEFKLGFYDREHENRGKS